MLEEIPHVTFRKRSILDNNEEIHVHERKAAPHLPEGVQLAQYRQIHNNKIRLVSLKKGDKILMRMNVFDRDTFTHSESDWVLAEVKQVDGSCIFIDKIVGD